MNTCARCGEEGWMLGQRVGGHEFLLCAECKAISDRALDGLAEHQARMRKRAKAEYKTHVAAARKRKAEVEAKRAARASLGVAA